MKTEISKLYPPAPYLLLYWAT